LPIPVFLGYNFHSGIDFTNVVRVSDQQATSLEKFVESSNPRCAAKFPALERVCLLNLMQLKSEGQEKQKTTTLTVDFPSSSNHQGWLTEARMPGTGNSKLKLQWRTTCTEMSAELLRCLGLLSVIANIFIAFSRIFCSVSFSETR